MSRSKLFFALTITAAAALGGCAAGDALDSDSHPGDQDQDDVAVPKLIDEDGVWLLEETDLDGAGELRGLDDTREDGYMLRFDSMAGIVAVASCQDREEREAGVPGDLTRSLCAQGAAPQFWHCGCFSYSYTDETMCWSDDLDLEPEVASCGGVKGETQVTVDTPAGINATMIVRPLPQGVFNSGNDSRYMLRQKVVEMFDVTGCSEFCGLTQ